MTQHESVDRIRRALLAAGGALILDAALWPASVPAQANGGAKMRIGVIGSGHIGGTIGGLWVKAGHPVLFSSRHPDQLKDQVTGLGALAQAGTVDQAIAFSEVVFLLVRDAGFDPVVVGKLKDASWFQRGGPGYGQAVTAPALKQALSLAP